jgi:hypothetical protein
MGVHSASSVEIQVLLVVTITSGMALQMSPPFAVASLLFMSATKQSSGSMYFNMLFINRL